MCGVPFTQVVIANKQKVAPKPYMDKLSFPTEVVDLLGSHQHDIKNMVQRELPQCQTLSNFHSTNFLHIPELQILLHALFHQIKDFQVPPLTGTQLAGMRNKPFSDGPVFMKCSLRDDTSDLINLLFRSDKENINAILKGINLVFVVCCQVTSYT